MWIPVMIQSENLRPVIFGGGPVAFRKAQTLCRYGVKSTLVCPCPPERILGLIPVPQWIEGTYQISHLEGATLIIAATDDREINRMICTDAEAKGIFALNASDGNSGTLSFPNVGKLEDITVVVSTGGSSPAAGARIISELLEVLEKNHWPERIRLLGELRRLLRKNEPDSSVRQKMMRTYGTMSRDELQKRRKEYED